MSIRCCQWEFLRQLSSIPTNTVIGLVRNKPAIDKRLTDELDARSNVHILQADITDIAALRAAATDTAKITGGGLDYLIGNAAYLTQWDSFDPISVCDQKPEEFEEVLLHYFRVNCIGNIHLFSTFTPLVLKGSVKKVISISSGHANTELALKLNVSVCPAYAISKAAQNMATAKFSMEYNKDGVLFLSLCPGMVDTGHFDDMTEEQQTKIMPMFKAFAGFAGPDFKGPRPVDAAVKDVLAVIEKASVEKGDGGAFYSHKGDTETWISA